MLLKDSGQERADNVAEDDGVRNLHHRGLKVHRKQHILLGGQGDLLAQEVVQGGHVHHGAVDHFTGFDRNRILEHRAGVVMADMDDLERVLCLHHDGLLTVPEVAFAHRGHVALGRG